MKNVKEDNSQHKQPGGGKGHSETNTEGGRNETPFEKNSIETERGTAVIEPYSDNHPTPEKNY